jgi:multimeric flavodoxin WrbA
METIVLNGARTGDLKVDEASETLTVILGNQATVFKLREISIADCLGCFGCWIKTPGECVIGDAAKDIAKKLMHTDLTVFVTPIVFGGYSYELKKILDRQICRELPFFTKVNGEVHHQPRYTKHARLVAIGVLPEPDAESESIFKSLVARNSVNMHAPAYSTAIVYLSDDSEVINKKIQTALEAVGVKN